MKLTNIKCPLNRKSPDCEACKYGKEGLCDYPNARYLSVFGPDVNEFGSYVYPDGTPFSLL